MKTILLIEDNLDMRENTAEILQLAKYKVLTAHNGIEGIKLAQTEKPDLIICDIMMPELDGYGVLHMLGKDCSTASIPFVFLSAKAEKSDQRIGMGMGADDYLTKPFENSELLHTIEVRLRKNEILRSEFDATKEGLQAFFKEARGFESLTTLSVDKEMRLYRKKERIYTEGNTPRSVFFIISGKVKICKANEEGKEFVTDLHKEGDFIGYTALLEDKPYADEAVVMEDAEVAIIPKEEFFTLLYSNRDVAGKFMKILSSNVVERENRLMALAYNSVRKRVAKGLLLLQQRYAKDDENLSMLISRENLAGIVGTSTESVTRSLSDFKDEKLISIKGSNISILDAVKLAKIKN